MPQIKTTVGQNTCPMEVFNQLKLIFEKVLLMRLKIFLSVLLLTVCNIFSQEVTSSFASKKSREHLMIKLKDSIIKKEADHFFNNQKVNWNAYSWATTLIIDDSPQNHAVLKKALKEYKQFSKSELQKVFESVFACFPHDFVDEVTVIAENETESEKVFASAVNYLARNNKDVSYLLKTKFNNNDKPILQALRNQFLTSYKPISFKELKKLIEFNSNKKIKFLYSVQHQNRDKIGKVFIQNENGKLVGKERKIMVIDQLARSATNLPMYITNGNTPVGLFRINNLAVSENVFIGPTKSFATYMPFECSADLFFNDSTKDFSLTNYLSFFPGEMRNNLSLQQSYWAGKAGRSEIYFHGTTIDQNLYIGKEFYGQTPSLGCLCTSEIWNDDGKLISSDQQKLVDAWMQSGNEDGYAYVLELNESDWKMFEKNINTLL
ncbi:hypothetical protein [Flavobacterium phragmitis]|uniref:Uncharacterized protein n=1 Tax=Flavobacterium phragmitis TaxID=739143 RepID=A0A1I1XUZ3_9FLAO|nr:hypothetical protein [Flavobacterium phragmitis]SFE11071.1 hypothetical protein SAMN05216297_12125 [Flavobacterium phragmitis]